MAGHGGRGTALVANATLRLLRERRNETQQEFAEAIRLQAAALGLNLGCDEKRVSRWERGEVTWPSAAYRRALMALLDCPAEQLGFVPPWCEPAARQIPRQLRPAFGSGVAFVPEDGDDPVKRRELLRASALASAAAVATELAWTVPAAEAAQPPPGTSQVRMSDVERVRATTRTFDDLDHRYGGGEVRASVVQYLDGTVLPMLRARHPDGVRGELFNAAAVLTELVGWMAYDTGDHRVARHYFGRALDLSDTVADHAYGAFVLASMSHQALYLGHGREAVELARAALHRTGAAAPPLLLTECHTMEARGHALAGDYRACVDSLRRATAEFERSDPARAPEWMGTFDETVFASHVGTCFRDLNRPTEAIRFTEQAVARHHPSQVRRRVYGNCQLATIHLAKGDLEAACRLGAEAMELAAKIASKRSVEHVRDVVYRLAPHQSVRQVRDFTEQARETLGG